MANYRQMVYIYWQLLPFSAPQNSRYPTEINSCEHIKANSHGRRRRFSNHDMIKHWDLIGFREQLSCVDFNRCQLEKLNQYWISFGHCSKLISQILDHGHIITFCSYGSQIIWLSKIPTSSKIPYEYLFRWKKSHWY